MNASIKLGRIWGIPIGLHSSWFLVFGLITLSLTRGYFAQEYPHLSTFAHLGLALATSLLFFSSVLLHELGHSIVALKNKIPVKGITLFIFGGIAQISREPDSPGTEFRIAVAGPMVSFGLAGLFGGLFLLSNQIPLLGASSAYLMRLNLTLALFNLIPGFPLDGGRILRSLVWKITSSYRRATRIASIGGQVIAFGFIGLGVLSIFTGQLVDGLWLVFIGWFLQSAASYTSHQLRMQEVLRGVTVGQAMTRDCSEIASLTTINQLVQERIIPNGQRCFFVMDLHGNINGLLTVDDISRIPQQKWRYVTAEQVMTPFNNLTQVEADSELLTALKNMEEANISQVPVVQFNRPVGVISRDQALRYLRLRTELGL
jgi:Zn-dependent protease/CBS domain-containing protein